MRTLLSPKPVRCQLFFTVPVTQVPQGAGFQQTEPGTELRSAQGDLSEGERCVSEGESSLGSGGR